MLLEIYRMMFKDSDWVLFVAAKDHQEAKKIFWRDHPEPFGGYDEYLDIRGRLEYLDMGDSLKKASIEIDEPRELTDDEIESALGFRSCDECNQYAEFVDGKCQNCSAEE